MTYRMLTLFLAGLTLAASIPGNVTKPDLDLPNKVPYDASEPVDPDFLGLAFELNSWVRYASDDDGNVNSFTRNLMDSIYSRTGGKPIIRLGGTSADYGKYLPGQEEPALPVAEQDNYQHIGGTTIGPKYWTYATYFPDAKYMIQVPLADANVSEAVAWAVSAVEGIGLENIHSIQIGNEPDLYSDDFRGADGVELNPPEYQGTLDNATYAGNYSLYTAAIRQAIDLPDNFFTAFDVAAIVEDHQVAQWLLDPETVFSHGIDPNNNTIKEVAHHYYQNHAGKAEDLELGLMTVNVTHTNLDYLKRRINWLRENRPQLPFIINEIGNSLEPKNSYEYQARLGSALWAVDFYLHSLTLGVARFNYQQIMHSGFDLWLPVASAGHEAQVFANYYSQVFLGDFIGNSNDTQVSKVDVSNADSVPNLAVYAAYEDSTVQRLAVANLQYWNRTSTSGPRPTVQLNIPVDEDVKSLQVTRLTSPDGAGADANSITYAGSQWSFASIGKEITGVKNDTTVVRVKDGIATVTVSSSEALLIYLRRYE